MAFDPDRLLSEAKNRDPGIVLGMPRFVHLLAGVAWNGS